jgi:hypothetical protein
MVVDNTQLDFKVALWDHVKSYHAVHLYIQCPELLQMFKFKLRLRANLVFEYDVVNGHKNNR